MRAALAFTLALAATPAFAGNPCGGVDEAAVYQAAGMDGDNQPATQSLGSLVCNYNGAVNHVDATVAVSVDTLVDMFNAQLNEAGYTKVPGIGEAAILSAGADDASIATRSIKYLSKGHVVTIVFSLIPSTTLPTDDQMLKLGHLFASSFTPPS